MSAADPLAIPLCTNQMDKDKPPCGLPMFRIGVLLGHWSWVCEKCDKIDRGNSLDAEITSE